MEETEFLSTEEIETLFGKSVANNTTEAEQNEEQTPEQQAEGKDIETTDDNGNNQSQESRGGKRGEDSTPKRNAEVSPNVFSSIAKALKDEGVFPDLDTSLVTDAESLKKVFNDQVDMRLSSQQKRVKEALDFGMEPSEIQMYENTLGYLFGLKDSEITDESTKGEELRKSLIFKDYLTKGFTEAKAKKEVEKSISTGSDIDDAKDALMSLKEFYHRSYQQVKARAMAEVEDYKERINKKLNDLKKSIDERENAFGSVGLDAKLKNQIYENIAKPTYKTPDGEYITAVDKYRRENEKDFLRYVGAFFTLTDGFTNFEKLFKPAAQKAVKSGFAQLEETLREEVKPDGGLGLWGGRKGDGLMGSKWKIDL